MNDKIKVLIIDDSKTARETLALILSSDPRIHIVGKAADPYEAVKIIARIRPDVITLDIEMPRMDGLTFLRKMMAQHPIPVIIISSLTLYSAEMTIKALEYGAIDIISKPFSVSLKGKPIEKTIVNKVLIASQTQIYQRRYQQTAQRAKSTTEAPKTAGLQEKPSTKLVAFGASTGGTEAFSEILQKLEYGKPSMVMVIHMPPVFTRAYAQRLNAESALNVKEAEHGEVLKNNHVYIAPGGFHTLVNREGGLMKIKVVKGDYVNHVKPSVDVFFKSLEDIDLQSSTALLLTGMGSDGAQGMKMLKKKGWTTIAQDEKSSLVFGMPRKAIELGAVSHVFNLDEIARYLNNNVYVL